jgi:hypothetical protein
VHADGLLEGVVSLPGLAWRCSRMAAAIASSLRWTACSARSSEFFSRASRSRVIAAIASPERCCHSVLRPATCVPSQSATTTTQKAKKLGELVKCEAVWAM